MQFEAPLHWFFHFTWPFRPSSRRRSWWDSMDVGRVGMTGWQVATSQSSWASDCQIISPLHSLAAASALCQQRALPAALITLFSAASPEQASKAGAPRSATPATQSAARSDPGTAAMAAPVAMPARTPTQKAPTRSILGLLPAGPRRNPYANLQFDHMDCSGMQVAKAVKAHGMGIAHVVLHPRKPIVVSCWI